VPSPPHVEDPTASSEYEVQLDNVIKRIERLNLDGNATPSQLVEQPRPSPKFPKWVTKTLESAHPNEAGKTVTRSLARQDDEGDVDDLDLGDVNDKEVSHDCELNLSTNFEPTSFEEVVSHCYRTVCS
jgi:hypothetical protein